MKRKARVLYTMHCYYNRAGTEEHTRSLAKGLSEDFETYIVAPEHERLVLFKDGREIIAHPIPSLPWPATPYRSAEFEEAFDRIVKALDPDLIHVQHFFNWPLSVLDQIASFKRPMCISFHDYYAITPHFTMEGTANPLVVTDSRYSKKLFGKDLSNYLQERQEQLRRSLKRFALKIVPSRYLASVLDQVYQGDYTVIPHGIEPFTCTKHDYVDGAPVFGYVGTLLPQKGFAHLGPVFKRLHEEYPNTSLKVFGGGLLAQLALPEAMIMHGAYEPKDLPSIMSQIDIGIITSTFAETFSLVLSEFWQAGIPVAASRIGALAERIKHGENGLLFAPGDEEDMYQTLKSFLISQDWRMWKVPTPRPLEQMLDDYRDLYRQLL
ncbi:MAG: glycosyltransferase family 4 protein [SAR324 cluster bacterium]|uniref:Glycosyltransferase family 4 protein n=1 Tax=SAR324 cluster bacterium TaxID=2024889 RepID=A0A7X9FRG0_9DELT|nr:glycosyltransferase family 4 protein [SAR324 cluster bacterium]